MSVLRREVIKDDVRVKRRQLEVGDLDDLAGRPSAGLPASGSASHLGRNVTLDPRVLHHPTSPALGSAEGRAAASSEGGGLREQQIHKRGQTLPATSTRPES